MPGSASVATGRLARISYILGSEPSPGDQLLLHPVADLDVPDVGTFHGGARMSDTRPRVWLISLSARLMGPRMCPILARRGHSPGGRSCGSMKRQRCCHRCGPSRCAGPLLPDGFGQWLCAAFMEMASPPSRTRRHMEQSQVDDHHAEH